MIGGVVGLRLAPDLLRQLAAGRQVVMVTGTNGKTTTTRLVAAAIGSLGQEVASNAFGANMESGLVSALIQRARRPIRRARGGRAVPARDDQGDQPRVVVLLNLSRDQMDRAAEIWLVAKRWREAFAGSRTCRVVANADDPLIAWAAGSADHVIWVAAGQRWHEDSWCCPECGSHLRATSSAGGAASARCPGRRRAGYSTATRHRRGRCGAGASALTLPGRANSSPTR